MKPDLWERLSVYIDRRYPQFRAGIREARNVSTERFAYIAGMYLEWLSKARGENAIEDSVDAFVQFTTEVNLAQARYEVQGAYEHKSFRDVYDAHYSQNEQMSSYLWGVYLTNFLWAHHVEICLFFQDRFLSRLPDDAKMFEIAPGHGGWGVWALYHKKRSILDGYDISPASIEIAGSIAAAAGVADRATYSEKDALDLQSVTPNSSRAGICSFLVEHLEEPQRLFAVVYQLLQPGGVAFITGALTAAQIDHIFEFRRESELVQMAESQGLRVLETLSTNPKRLLPRARFIPRSMAMLVQKPDMNPS